MKIETSIPKTDKIVFVLFTSRICAHCGEVRKRIEKIESVINPEKAIFIDIDGPAFPNDALKYSVVLTPTFMALKDDIVLFYQAGAEAFDERKIYEVLTR
jgi:thiol-disulfide isomerase/thioredoxin